MPEPITDPNDPNYDPNLDPGTSGDDLPPQGGESGDDFPDIEDGALTAALKKRGIAVDSFENLGKRLQKADQATDFERRYHEANRKAAKLLKALSGDDESGAAPKRPASLANMTEDQIAAARQSFRHLGEPVIKEIIQQIRAEERESEAIESFSDAHPDFEELREKMGHLADQYGIKSFNKRNLELLYKEAGGGANPAGGNKLLNPGGTGKKTVLGISPPKTDRKNLSVIPAEGGSLDDADARFAAKLKAAGVPED